MNSHRQGVTLLPAQPVHPPAHTAWPPPHSVGQQCCGLNSQLRSQFLPSNFEVHSQESASPKRLHISILFSLGALKKQTKSCLNFKNVEKHFTTKSHRLKSQVTHTGDAHRHNIGKEGLRLIITVSAG